MASAACGVLCAALPAPDTLLCVLRSVAGWFPGGEAGACAPQAAVEVAAFTARTLLLAGDFACAFAALTSDFPVAAVAGPVIDRSSAYQFHRALLGWVSGRRHVVPADGRFVHRTAQEIDRASVKAFPLCTGLHAPDDLSLQDGMPGDRSRAWQIHCQGLPCPSTSFCTALRMSLSLSTRFPQRSCAAGSRSSACVVPADGQESIQPLFAALSDRRRATERGVIVVPVFTERRRVPRASRRVDLSLTGGSRFVSCRRSSPRDHACHSRGGR